MQREKKKGEEKRKKKEKKSRQRAILGWRIHLGVLRGTASGQRKRGGERSSAARKEERANLIYYKRKRESTLWKKEREKGRARRPVFHHRPKGRNCEDEFAGF